MIKVGDLDVTVDPEPDGEWLMIQYDKWDNAPDGLWRMNQHGDVIRVRPYPSRLPAEMLDQMYEHQDKLKTIFLLGRK